MGFSCICWVFVNSPGEQGVLVSFCHMSSRLLTLSTPDSSTMVLIMLPVLAQLLSQRISWVMLPSWIMKIPMRKTNFQRGLWNSVMCLSKLGAMHSYTQEGKNVGFCAIWRYCSYKDLKTMGCSFWHSAYILGLLSQCPRLRNNLGICVGFFLIIFMINSISWLEKVNKGLK